MKKIKVLFYIHVMGVLFLLGCSIYAPEIHVTSDKLAFEREVLGSYHQLEEETWMIASTRSGEVDTSGLTLSGAKRRVLEAIQRQKFNRDDIEEFKQKGFIGENNKGFVEIRPSEELEKKPETLRFVEELINEENEDRRLIMGRIIELNESLKKASRDDVSTIFARMYQDNSKNGSWIQKPDGSWIQK